MIDSIIMISIAVLTLAAAMVVFVILPLVFKRKQFTWNKRLTLTIALLFFSIASLRLFESTVGGITVEAVLDSILTALKTFLADGEIQITGHFEILEKTTGCLFFDPEAFWIGVLLKTVAAIVDLSAPLLTLTAVLSVLSQMFPKLWISISFFRKKFVFSELNEEIVVLAESIDKQFGKSFFKPMLIVTDAYADAENEKSSELLERLKAIGCLCIKEDVLNLTVRARRGLTYVLSDKDMIKNLSVALKLTKRFAEKPKKYLKHPNHVYVFSDMDEAEELLSEECKNLSEIVSQLTQNIKGKKKSTKYYLPYIVPVKEYKNAVYDLLYSVPLYTPLIGTNRKELNVTILGSGKIGTEVFYAVYWCGQMLDIKLNITVVSLDAVTAFKNRLNRCNQDILRSTKYDNPYCSIALISCDLEQISYEELLGMNLKTKSDGYTIDPYGDICDAVHKTDYYIVALGSDQRNINTVSLLRRALERSKLKGECAEDKQIMIAVSIYDDTVSELMNYEDKDSKLRIRSFASFSTRFSYQNVINGKLMGGAQRISDAYDSLTAKYVPESMEKIYGEKNKAFDYYKYWSNVARQLHQKYVMFSVGIHDANGINSYIDKLRDDELCDKLAWLEHRRWNAHLRTMGYIYFDTEKTFKGKKVHPCLVDIDKPCRHHRIPYKITTVGGESKRECTLKDEDFKGQKYDALDYACHKHEYACDTRIYDYPQSAEIRLNDSQMKTYLHPAAGDYYASKINPDSHIYELYKPHENDGERIWSIQRLLLDVSLQEQLAKLLRKNKNEKASVASQSDTIVAYFKGQNMLREDGFMTRERALEVMKTPCKKGIFARFRSDVCKSHRSSSSKKTK